MPSLLALAFCIFAGMTFRHRLQYFLVKKLRISNKQALALIKTSEITVDGIPTTQNIEITKTNQICHGAVVLQQKVDLVYYAFHKPRGLECTFNEEIKDNIKTHLPFKEEVFLVGRLDKDSEGLLLFTNDGTVFDKTLRPQYNIEKEYIVTVNQPITDAFIQKMANGIPILGKVTDPCFVEKLTEYEFRIILKQGINRQIRRMCYKLGYEVITLKRVRIGTIELGLLPELGYRALQGI